MKEGNNVKKKIMLLLIAVSVLVFISGCDDFTEEVMEEVLWEENNTNVSFTSMLETDCFGNEEFRENEGICVSVYACDNLEDCQLSGDELLYAILEMDETIYDEISYTDSELQDENVLVKFRIKGNELLSVAYKEVADDLIYFQQEESLQNETWNLFAYLIPKNEREMVQTFGFFTDGPSNTLAYVEPISQEEWLILYDIQDVEHFGELVYTTLHEFAHILTLNSSQIEIDSELLEEYIDEDYYHAAMEGCQTYFPGEGCSFDDSYIYLFYKQFWEAYLYEEWDSIDTEKEEELEKFYLQYEEEFVSDYAATSLEEDIAESFTAFILLEEQPGVEIWEEKINFFYQFPELVKLRTEILARLHSIVSRRY